MNIGEIISIAALAISLVSLAAAGGYWGGIAISRLWR